jgi:malonyl-CoA O-methyltransferase
LRSFSHVTLVDLPGFGRSQQLIENNLENCLQALCEVLPERAIYLGFSFGGMLAVKMAHQFPGRVRAVVTISSNARFVADDSWPHAMDENTFASFYQLCQEQPEAAFKMFLALQARGCESERTLLKQLKKQLGSEVPNQRAMTSSLLLLSGLDNSVALEEMECLSLHIYGENDDMVPLAAAQKIKEFNNLDVHVIPGASHVPFISHRQQCLPVIEGFLRKQGFLDSVKAIRLLDKK